MTKSISEDLRFRVIAAVDGGLSRRAAAERCGGKCRPLGSRMAGDWFEAGWTPAPRGQPVRAIEHSRAFVLARKGVTEVESCWRRRSVEHCRGRRIIESVKLTRFKRFTNLSFALHPTSISFLAGGNNSGKSTLLQAIAVWEFCRLVLENERGRESLSAGYGGQGLGLSDDEFSPIAVASLKHLWTNLKSQIPGQDGYSLSIECGWTAGGVSKQLCLSLALTNDRLFVKAAASNLTDDDALPAVAYLPPFAGIAQRENKMSGAERRGLIGRGLAGGVIRNLLLDMHETNLAARAKLKEGRTKIKSSDLKQVLLATHSTEILRSAEHTQIMEFRGASAKYLDQDERKVSLFIGLGSEYAPKLDPLRKSKRMLIVEASSDAKMLQAWAKQLGIEWPKKIVIWPWTGGATERKHLFLQLKAEIPDLVAVSLRDRDDMAIGQIDKATLSDRSQSNVDPNLHLKI